MLRKIVTTVLALISIILICSYVGYSLGFGSFVVPSYLFGFVLGIIAGCISLFLHLTTRNESSSEGSV